MDNQNIKSLKRLAHGVGISLIFGFIAYVIMFLFKLIAARYFGPEDFGLFSLTETILGICVIIGLLGISAGPGRYIPIYKHRKQYKKLAGYYSFIFKVPVLLSIILSILILVFASQINSFFNFPENFVNLLRLVALIIPFYVVNHIMWNVFFAEGKIFNQNISRNVIERAPLLVGIAIIYFLKLNVFYLVLFFIIPIFLAFVYNTIIYKKKIHFPEVKEKTYLWKDWFSFSLPLFFTGIFSYFIHWTDNLVIGKYLTPQSLGIYSVAFSLSHFLLFFTTIFNFIFKPIISERYAYKDKKSITFLFRKSQNWIFSITLPIALLLIIFSKQILNLIYGVKYITGFLPLLILSLGFIINIYLGLNTNILQLHKKTKYIFKVNVFVAITNIILNIFLIQLIGIIGAAISTSFSLSLRNILFLYKTKKLEKLHFSWWTNFKFLISGLICVAIAKILFVTIHFNIYIKLISIGLLYFLLYGIFLVISRAFDKDDFQIMLAIEKRLGVNFGFFKKIVMKFY
ncbi:flippase [Candidatus Woesearchaeota archaeon]|nr:flippase [Candidatus Woesearchaeota archaeon]